MNYLFSHSSHLQSKEEWSIIIDVRDVNQSRGKSRGSYLCLHLFQFDFVKLMDGKQLVKQDSKSSDDTQHSPRNLILTSLQETGFIEYMDQGPWYLAFYNDGKKMEQVFVLTTAIGKLPWLWFWIDSITPERHSDESDTDVIEAYCSFCLKVITQDTSQWDRFILLLSVMLFKCRLRFLKCSIICGYFRIPAMLLFICFQQE